MAALTISAGDAGAGALVRTKLDDAFKSGTTGGATLPPPMALTSIPSVVLDLYEIAFIAGYQVTNSSGVPLPSFTVVGAGILGASGRTGLMIYVSDEAGGAVPAFSDGTNWRRVTDRAIIS